MATIKASVFIDSGIDPLCRLEFVPQEHWKKLVEARNGFISVEFTKDCRQILEWVQDAEVMWKPLGYKSRNDLISEGYGLNPEEVRLAARWLELNEPPTAIPYNEAVKGGRQQQGAIEKVKVTRPAMAAEGGDPTPLYKNGKCTRLPTGNSSARRIARLKRDCPEAVERLERGEFKSVRAAERWARGEDPHPPHKIKSNYEKAQVAYSKLDTKERKRFRKWIDEQ